MTSQPYSNVMSIDAIISPCLNQTNPPLPSLCKRSSQDWQSVGSSEQWNDLKRAHYDSLDEGSLPSFYSSSISSHSDHEDSEDPMLHQWYTSDNNPHSRRQTTGSIFSKQDDLFDLKQEFRTGRSTSFNYGDGHCLYTTSAKKGHENNTSALATRRARNKLASAKYRAKKQALTHAMQGRIMQLATQVMTLRKELSETRNREREARFHCEQLIEHYQVKMKSTM